MLGTRSVPYLYSSVLTTHHSPLEEERKLDLASALSSRRTQGLNCRNINDVTPNASGKRNRLPAMLGTGYKWVGR